MSQGYEICLNYDDTLYYQLVVKCVLKTSPKMCRLLFTIKKDVGTFLRSEDGVRILNNIKILRERYEPKELPKAA